MSSKIQVPAKAAPTSSFTPAPTGLLQRKCACGGKPGLDGECVECRQKRFTARPNSTGLAAPTATSASFGHYFGRVRVRDAAPQISQTKLKVNEPGDKFEQEADRVADQVMRMPEPGVSAQPGLFSQTNRIGIQRVCPECEEELHGQPIEEEKEEEEELLQAKAASSRTPEVTPQVQGQINAMRGTGQPLPESDRAFFEPRFGYDFSQVRIHTDGQAAGTAQGVRAKAFTMGRDIVFGAGEYTPQTTDSRMLLAHELTHVIQQGQGSFAERPCLRQSARRQTTAGPPLVQRQSSTLVGSENVCIGYEPRELELRGEMTPLPDTETPGGRVIPGTAGPHQNCAGVSLCGREEYINWPYLGLEAADGVSSPGFTADWVAATYFVPLGCSPVSCAGVSLSSTACLPSEREVILFLYRWPVGEVPGTSTVVYQSDFHMVGRTPSSLPMAWESKMDNRERVEDIRNPRTSLADAYPHTSRADRDIAQQCYCCDCAEITTR